MLPLSPGRAERHGFEYFRHGTLSLYAALNTASGEVLGKTANRHTSAEFVAFLANAVATQPAEKEIHVIAGNLSAHKTKAVSEFLALHPNLQLHCTPTYSSWLNQVEIWFSKIQRDLTTRGIFTSRADLARKIARYIKSHNKVPSPSNGPTEIPTVASGRPSDPCELPPVIRPELVGPERGIPIKTHEANPTQRRAIIAVLQEAQAGSTIEELCRRHGISAATYYKWKQKFGGLEVKDAQRLRLLEEENRKLKKTKPSTTWS